MELKDKLQLLRKQNGYSQEQLADKLGIARQTLSKWENGQAVPELGNLISLSNLYGITIDRIVKEDDEWMIVVCRMQGTGTKIFISRQYKTTRRSFKMGDNHDLLNDNDMCSFSGHEAEDMCFNCGDHTC